MHISAAHSINWPEKYSVLWPADRRAAARTTVERPEQCSDQSRLHESNRPDHQQSEGASGNTKLDAGLRDPRCGEPFCNSDLERSRDT
jgi:hypothetical protein